MNKTEEYIMKWILELYYWYGVYSREQSSNNLFYSAPRIRIEFFKKSQKIFARVILPNKLYASSAIDNIEIGFVGDAEQEEVSDFKIMVKAFFFGRGL